jgi:hypothetical protein
MACYTIQYVMEYYDAKYDCTKRGLAKVPAGVCHVLLFTCVHDA